MEEELTAMFRVCVHIKKDGIRCNSPALKGGNFCFQHIGGSLREHTRARSTYNGPQLDFLYPGTRQAIQHNFFVVAQAMNDGNLELATANSYNRIFSACERNLRRWEMQCQKSGVEPELVKIPDEAPGAGADGVNGGEQNPSVSSAASGVNPSLDECSLESSLGGNHPSTTAATDQATQSVIPAVESAAGIPTERSSSVRLEANEAEEPALSNPIIDVILSEVSVANEVEEPASSSPSENAEDQEQNPSVPSSVVKPEPCPEPGKPALSPGSSSLTLHDVNSKKRARNFPDLPQPQPRAIQREIQPPYARP